MTKEQRREMAKQDVQETLALIEKYGFEYVDLAEHRRRTRFFYRQSNEQIGVIIPYHSALKMNGEPKVCYELHCFDINVVYAHNISEAVDCVMRDNSNVMLDFWIPSFRASKPNHAYILDCLCKETETDKDKLEAKYSSLKKGTRCWKN